jgi:hypothetical protein
MEQTIKIRERLYVSHVDVAKESRNPNSITSGLLPFSTLLHIPSEKERDEKLHLKIYCM